MSKMKWSIVILASIAALAMSIIALYSPWWSESYHYEEDKIEKAYTWGLDEKSEDIVYSEDCYKYTCPFCGETVAYNEDELEEVKYCCPECGHFVGWSGSSCFNCGATFEERAFKCRKCDKLVTDPEEEIYIKEGDIEKETEPLSNTKIVKAKEEEGIMNRVGASNTAHNIWLLSIFLAALAVSAIIISGLNGRLPKPVIISMGIASVLTLGGVVYYSTAWTSAYEDDWNDIYGETEKCYGRRYVNHTFGLPIIPDENNEPEQVVSSFSGYKKHQPEDENSGYVEFSWGPQRGWIIGLISSILFTLTTILLYISRNDLNEDYYDDEEYEDEEEEDEEDEYRYEKREEKLKSPAPKTSKYPSPQPEKKCIKCSSVIMDPLAVFCHNCGANQSLASPSPVSTPPTAIQANRDTSQTPLQTAPELMNCPNCSSLNLASADACMMCGAVLKGGGTGPYSSAPGYSMPQRYSYPPPPP